MRTRVAAVAAGTAATAFGRCKAASSRLSKVRALRARGS